MTSYTNSPRGVTKSVGNQDYRFVPSYIRPRDPLSPTATSPDIKPKEQQGYYPISSLWTNSTNGNVWVLAGIVNNLANWLLISSGGSGPAIMFQVQSSTAPGVNPVTATGGGLITVNGNSVANHSVPVETHSRALNAYNVEVQYATSAAATDATKSGLAHFNSTQFSVDANGFVALAGGGIAIDSINVDANTAPGTDPVVPDGAGQITVTGGQVATGTIGANVIRTNSLAANTYTIQIQRSTNNASTDLTKNGVCHFNSSDFNVDANGFVSLTGGPPGFTWNVINQGTQPANFVVNNGYICQAGGTGNVSIALPAASVLGDTIEITLDGATSWTITQGAGQQIRAANAQTTVGAGGSIASTLPGDRIRLVCETANLKWVEVGMTGNLTVV